MKQSAFLKRFFLVNLALMLFQAQVLAAPAAPTKPDLKNGKKVYDTHCVTCHGKTGKGDGPAGKALKARDFTQGKFLYGGKDADLIKVIKNGKNAMPPYKQLSAKDLTDIVAYIRSLKKK